MPLLMRKSPVYFCNHRLLDRMWQFKSVTVQHFERNLFWQFNAECNTKRDLMPGRAPQMLEYIGKSFCQRFTIAPVKLT